MVNKVPLRVSTSGSPVSCGVGLMYDIWYQSPRDIIKRIAENREDYSPFYIFSDVENASGDRLSTFITKNKLGKVYKTRARFNPNSGNLIKVYVWSVDHNALNAWK